MRKQINFRQFLALALVLLAALSLTACPSRDARKLIESNNVIAHSIDTLATLNKNLLDTGVLSPQDAVTVAQAVKDANEGLRQSQVIARQVKSNLTLDQKAQALMALTSSVEAFQRLVAVGTLHIKNPDKQKLFILSAQAGLSAVNVALAIVSSTKAN